MCQHATAVFYVRTFTTNESKEKESSEILKLLSVLWQLAPLCRAAPTPQPILPPLPGLLAKPPQFSPERLLSPPPSLLRVFGPPTHTGTIIRPRGRQGPRLAAATAAGPRWLVVAVTARQSTRLLLLGAA